MAKINLQYEFDSFEEHAAFQVQVRASDFYDALLKLENSMRDAYKHDKLCDDHCQALIEKWREMISETGIHDIHE